MLSILYFYLWLIPTMVWVHHMLRAGLEPARSYDQKNLNLPSLPISSPEQIKIFSFQCAIVYSGFEPEITSFRVKCLTNLASIQ